MGRGYAGVKIERGVRMSAAGARAQNCRRAWGALQESNEKPRAGRSLRGA